MEKRTKVNMPPSSLVARHKLRKTPFEMEYRHIYTYIQGIFSATIPALSPLFSTKRDYFCIFYEIPNVREHLIRQYFCTEWGVGGRICCISTYFDITPFSAVAPLELPQESADRREKGFSLSRGGCYLLKSSFDCALSSLQPENQFLKQLHIDYIL